MRLSVIGITGFAGVGKSTLARYLSSSHGYTELSLADPLKAAAMCLGWNGEKDEKGRRFLQQLGTEAIRSTFGEDFWADLLIERIHNLNPRFVCPYDEQQCEYAKCITLGHVEFNSRCMKRREERMRVAVSDVRFINEAEKLRKVFGERFLLIRVSRQSTGPCNNHSSEIEQTEISADFGVINPEGNPLDMCRVVEQLLLSRGHLGAI